MAKKKSNLDVFGLEWGDQTYGKESKQKIKDDDVMSFVTPDNKDGAIVIDDQQFGGGGGGRATAQMTFHAEYDTESDLITLYRKMAQQADVENAVDDIVNDSIVMSTDENTVSIDLSDIQAGDTVKKAISEEFDNVLKLLKFRDEGDEKFRRWYVDGRQVQHMVVDTDRPTDGIKEIREIDPRYIKLVREIKREKRGNMEIVKGFREYYLYSDPKMGNIGQAIEISPKAISYVHSGMVDPDKVDIKTIGDYKREMIVSHLHKAIKPFNRLNQLEDALVIYRISRAPERLVFYVDIGNLNKTRAESFMRENMNKYKNKLVFDSKTGKVKNDRHIMSVMENVWLPRKQGSRGTEVSSLTGAMNLGNIDDVEYFKRNLQESLKVPLSRRQDDGGILGSRTTEISRDELKFQDFVDKLRNRYSKTFLIILKTQCILKGVCTEDDWLELRDDIKFTFASNSYFSELKEQEIWSARFESLQAMGVENPVGKYVSNEWVRKVILRQSDDEIKEEDKLIKSEQSIEQYKPDDEDSDFGGSSFEPEKPEPKPVETNKESEKESSSNEE